MSSKHLPVRTIAMQFCLAEKTVCKLVKDGKVPAVRVGRVYRINPEEFRLALSNSPSPRAR